MLTRNGLFGEIIVLADGTINLFHGCKEKEREKRKKRVSNMVRCNVQLPVGIVQQQQQRQQRQQQEVLLQRTFFDWIHHVVFHLAGERMTMNTMTILHFLHLHGVGV